jgi:hypothetical protein
LGFFEYVLLCPLHVPIISIVAYNLVQYIDTVADVNSLIL